MASMTITTVPMKTSGGGLVLIDEGDDLRLVETRAGAKRRRVLRQLSDRRASALRRARGQPRVQARDQH
jgi:hypothetical protein